MAASASNSSIALSNTATNSMRNTSSEGNSGGGDDRQPSKGNEPAREHYVDDKTTLVGLIVMLRQLFGNDYTTAEGRKLKAALFKELPGECLLRIVNGASRELRFRAQGSGATVPQPANGSSGSIVNPIDIDALADSDVIELSSGAESDSNDTMTEGEGGT